MLAELRCDKNALEIFTACVNKSLMRIKFAVSS